MIDNSVEIEKIIVSPEDELVDILKEIERTKANRIILTFAESSDILISPINLKVIQDSADDLKKPLISLIVQNPIGVRNAKEAGMTVTESSGSIIDTFWEQSEKNMESRILQKKANLRRTHNTPINTKKDEVISPENAMDVETLAYQANVQRRDGEKTEFQTRIKEALEKSKRDVDSRKQGVESNGVEISFDQELAEESPSLLGKSFKDIGDMKFLGNNNESNDVKRGVKIPKLNFLGIFPTTLAGWMLRVVLPLFLILGISGYLAYTSLPLVKVKVYVESKGVDIEKTFTGDLKTTALDLENSKVPLKREEVNKSASNSTKATGTAYKGTKAEGVVLAKYYDIIGNPSGVTLKAGTVLTSTTNTALKFEITADAKVDTFPDFDPIPVRALGVGEEYNLAAGQVFSVQGYGQAQMDASSTSPFEGGSKTAYTVLSKADVDKVVDGLKKNLLSESENELKERVDGTWELVEKSLKSEVDGDPETDVPIGAEADTVNVTVKTKSTAFFYQKSELEASILDMLVTAAQDKNLFDNTSTDKFFAQDNIEKEIAISDIKKDSIKISVKASANIQPNIDKNDLINQLKGKRWEQGTLIVQNLKFTDKENTVSFSPEYFPDWLKYFPSRQGRLFIDIEQVVSEQ